MLNLFNSSKRFKTSSHSILVCFVIDRYFWQTHFCTTNSFYFMKLAFIKIPKRWLNPGQLHWLIQNIKKISKSVDCLKTLWISSTKIWCQLRASLINSFQKSYFSCWFFCATSHIILVTQQHSATLKITLVFRLGPWATNAT